MIDTRKFQNFRSGTAINDDYDIQNYQISRVIFIGLGKLQIKPFHRDVFLLGPLTQWYRSHMQQTKLIVQIGRNSFGSLCFHQIKKYETLKYSETDFKRQYRKFELKTNYILKKLFLLILFLTEIINVTSIQITLNFYIPSYF